MICRLSLDYEHRAQVIACLNKLDCQYFMTGVDKKDFEIVGGWNGTSDVPHGTWCGFEG